MDLVYFFAILCTIPGVICAGSCVLGNVLSGITIAILLIVIICLSIALYLVRNNKTIFGVSITKKSAYFRQESEMGVTLCNVTSTNNVNNMTEHGRDDGSTLTVNSGIVEIGSLTEPETPTRTEENKMPYIAKKPKGPIIPTMQKAQMDKIIGDVLSRKQKSDSATLRDLDVLTKSKTLKSYDNEFAVRRNSASLNHLDALANGEVDESLYENAHAIQEMKSKFTTNTMKSQTKDTSQKNNLMVPKNVKQSISADSLQSKQSGPVAEDEHEVYDTLPNKSFVRCVSNPESDECIENIPVYDLPPQRNENKQPRNVILDPDSQYLLPISKKLDEDEENSYYVNAKRRHN